MENSFDVLEEKVRKAADLVRRLRKENQSLDEALGKSKDRLAEAERKLAHLEQDRGAAAEGAREAEAAQRELKALRREREEIKNRIGRIVEILEGLD
jgi:predicted RNase H-like nuclease (RuvC/YqgF family)